MPIMVSCDELRAGMRLFEPLLSGDRVMLQSGKELNGEEVAALRRRFPGLMLRVGDPILDETVDFEDDGQDRQVAQAVQQRIMGAMSQVQTRYTEQASLRSVDFRAIHAAVAEIIQYLRLHPGTTPLLTACLEPNSYLGTHTGNVFYLSMLLGSAAQLYVCRERNRQSVARDLRQDFVSDLTPLGIGAMFMDVGMLPLTDLVGVDRKLTADERDLMREHPEAGARLLPEALSPVARMIVRTHHENCNGTGYPQGLPAERLHVFARIVRIADAFDAATSDRIYCQAKSAARALWEMTRGGYQACYDPVLLEIFSRIIQPFPIGAKLRLTDGRYAVAVKYNRRNPFMPTVVIAFDDQDRPLPRQEVEGPYELEAHPELQLSRFRGEDLSFLHSSPPGPAAQPERSTAFDNFYP